MIYPVMFGIGFYGSFIQVGVGFIFMAALYHILKLDLVYVNMHKVFIILIYMIPTLLIFLATGNVNWLFGLCLAAGNAFGGWWGAFFRLKAAKKLSALPWRIHLDHGVEIARPSIVLDSIRVIGYFPGFRRIKMA